MTNTIKLLAGLLLVQVGLMVWLFSSGDRGLDAFHSNQNLLGFDLAAVDSIIVEKLEKFDGDEDDLLTTKLARKGDGWALADFNQFPVSPAKIDKVVKPLFELKKSWPVGKTRQAHKPFKVSDKEFNRKITFRKGDQELGVLILGSAPGFRKVHARQAGSDLTYAIKFTAGDIPTKNASWIDKDLLRLKIEDLASVELNDLKFEAAEAGLQLAGLTDQEELDNDQYKSLINKLGGLVYEDVLGEIEIFPDRR